MPLVMTFPWWSPWPSEADGSSRTSDTPTTAVTPHIEPREIRFTIAGGGDMLIHNTVYSAARTNGGYDFVPLMESTAEYTRGTDLALCNLEVPLIRPDQEPSNFPTFGSPPELAQNLADLGWDGCSTANNHSLDRGFDALQNTLDLFDEVGLGHAGTARTEAEAQRPQFYELERGGETITIAQIAATFSTNGIPLPADAPWSVQSLDADVLVDQARQARADGADLVIASVHCCVEYVTTPDEMQVQVAEALADSGEVDLVLGHHAHVPQTIEQLDGGPDGVGMWVAWGLGNFISDQSVACCREETSTGLLAFFEVAKVTGEPPRILGASWTAVTMDRTAGRHARILTAEGSPGNGTPAAELARRHQQVAGILADSPATERTEPPQPTGDPARVIPRGD